MSSSSSLSDAPLSPSRVRMVRSHETTMTPTSPVSLTESVRDDILDITPVQTYDEEEEPEEDEEDLGAEGRNECAFSSSSESGPEGEEDDEEYQDDKEEEDGDNDEDPYQEEDRSSEDEDLEEEEDDEFDEEEDDDNTSTEQEGPRHQTNAATSEWDKALRSGKPSTGHASDFFAAPSYSMDSNSEVGGLQLESSPVRALRPARSRDSTASQSNTANNNNNHHLMSRPSLVSVHTNSSSLTNSTTAVRPHPADHDLSAGVLPDVLMNVRQKIESLSLFDSDMMRLAADDCLDDPLLQESRASLKRSSQQSISAAVLVSLAHKRYERRRLAAMEIEKVVRSLVVTAAAQQHKSTSELDRVRAILLLLSDDYVRSTSEDARKGGVVALAACAIGLKKAAPSAAVQECRDLILASVVHACQDHSQRVRYYATESLFNVVKVIPSLAVQHFFILFEILRSLYADVDPDVRSGADLLDKKLKEVIVSAMNVGTFQAEACVPVFARFVYMRNKATKRLTLTWLQELNERLIGAPILEFLHLFCGGIFDMVADPTVAIRQSALAFLQSVLPKLLVVHEQVVSIEDGVKVDFDKILQSLVSTMEHPDPFVRKVAVYWMSRIVKAHMSSSVQAFAAATPPPALSPMSNNTNKDQPDGGNGDQAGTPRSTTSSDSPEWTGAALSVRNAVPHVLPGILLSIGDSYVSYHAKDSFLPDQTTRALAEQTNACLQDAVRRDGAAYVQHLDSFIVALREELDSPGTKLVPAVERTPYRMDVAPDGTGIETAGWFRTSSNNNGDTIIPPGGGGGRTVDGGSMVMSRLCALDWVIVLYESVVPDLLKADYAREFVFAIIHQLSDCPPKTIVDKSLEVLAKITVPVAGEDFSRVKQTNLSLGNVPWVMSASTSPEETAQFPITESNIEFALGILEPSRRVLMSRDREVFCALIELHAANDELVSDLSRVITYMCKLQPPEFVFVSFAVELDRFVRKRIEQSKESTLTVGGVVVKRASTTEPLSKDLSFVSSFVQQMVHVLLNADEAEGMRKVLKDCIGSRGSSDHDRQRTRLFHILLHSYAHSMAAALSLCLWVGAYRTASLFLKSIDPLDINLIFFLEIDRLVEMLERPLFRHVHIRMLERDTDPRAEGSGAMLFQLLKSLLMILPQSTCFRVLQARLMSVSRFRQVAVARNKSRKLLSAETDVWVERVEQVRSLHCAARWLSIRAESLEVPKPEPVDDAHQVGSDRREWLGYTTQEEERKAQERYRLVKTRPQGATSATVEEIVPDYDDLETLRDEETKLKALLPNAEENTTADVQGDEGEEDWKSYWEGANP